MAEVTNIEQIEVVGIHYIDLVTAFIVEFDKKLKVTICFLCELGAQDGDIIELDNCQRWRVVDTPQVFEGHHSMVDVMQYTEAYYDWFRFNAVVH